MQWRPADASAPCLSWSTHRRRVRARETLKVYLPACLPRSHDISRSLGEFYAAHRTRANIPCVELSTVRAASLTNGSQQIDIAVDILCRRYSVRTTSLLSQTWPFRSTRRRPSPHSMPPFPPSNVLPSSRETATQVCRPPCPEARRELHRAKQHRHSQNRRPPPFHVKLRL